MPDAYDPFEFRPLTFYDAIPAFLEGSDTPRAYLERCLETIAVREPVVRAWVTVNEDGARKAADAATERYRAGRPLSSIDGMPIGIKDLFVTRDMPTKMGSPLYEDNFPRQDTACVQAMRDAGGVILGKTVTTELGMSHPGPTTNPFSEKHTPGGSSSGSAAVIGARMVPAALGSQVIGSCIRPASFCANYALKPSFGAIHRGERLGFSQSHLGIHAGSLPDMWNLAYETARRVGGDPGHPGLFGPATLADPLRPSRLAVIEAEGWASVDAATRAAFEDVLDRLRAEGVEIVGRADDPVIEAFERAIGESLAICRDVCAFEQRWTLRNLIDQFGGGLSDSMMTRYDLSTRMSVEDYRVVLMRREEARRALAAAASAGDAMICLSSVGPAPLLDNDGLASGISHTTGLPGFNGWTSVTGAPSLNLPLLAVGGMPVGVQIVGQLHQDHRLSGMGRWMMDVLKARAA